MKNLAVIIGTMLIAFGAAVLYHNMLPERQAATTPGQETPKEFRVTLIDLYASRCPACRVVAPVIEEIEQQYAGQVTVLYYNVDEPENRVISQKYQVRAIPTLVFLDANGKQYAKHVGDMNKEQIVKVLRRQGVR